MSDQLTIWWWDGFPIARLVGEGRDLRLTYTSEAQDRWPANSPVVSCALPVRAEGMDASRFFRGVLPEGPHLAALAARAGLAVTDTFGLLKRYGRDIAGALIVAPEHPGTRPGEIEPYSPESLAEEVQELGDHPLGIHDDSELSIAGLQDKLLLVRTTEGWARPIAGAPSTHILKVDDRRHPGLVAAEAASLRIARSLELTTVDVEEIELGGQTCLIVSRFDRRIRDEGAVERRHQEDACQALDVDPESALGRGKYEAAGGPTLKKIAGLLDAYSRQPLTQLDRLVAVTTFTVLIANADAHGKNLAFLHDDAEIELAPLYDQVPTVLWPRLRTTPAMSIGPRVAPFDELDLTDIVAEAKLWPHDPDRARAVALRTSERAAEAAENCGHDGVAELVVRRAERLLG
jgi:serine/threonine-protein kinase HipA